MIRLLAIAALLALAVPATSSAQALVPLLPDPSEPQVLPVFRSSDGRLEALLLLDEPQQAVNPLDRLIEPRSRGLGVSARLNLNAAQTLEAALKLDRSSGLALLCGAGSGFASSLTPLSQHCLLAPLGGSEHDPLGQALRPRLESAWRHEALGLDLRFGLSWLDTGFGNSALPGGDAPGAPALFGRSALETFGLAPGTRFEDRALGLGGVMELGERSWLSVEGSLGRSRLSGNLLPGALSNGWDHRQLRVGLGYGDFSGVLTGRLIEVPGADLFWGGVDLGVSWRTPWAGEITVGARNLMSTGAVPGLVDPEAATEGEGRIPYVRYHQDL